MVSRLGQTTAPPSWSPEGEELAFAAVEGEEAVLYAAKPDDTGLREVWRSGADGPSAPIVQVAWSPDGKEILFVSDGVYVVGGDGGGLRMVLHGSSATRAAWSPDGSRIAVSQQGYSISTVSRDGTDLRPLVQADDEGRLYAWPDPEASADLAACSAGVVVPDPQANPGLVQDCEALLSFRHRIAQGTEMGWSERRPIGGWRGVTLDGSLPRVHEVLLRDRGLIGTFSPELGALTELRVLNLSGNDLAGPIPPELGNLTKLVQLDLRGNDLRGPIPSELGNLTELSYLDLSSNPLGGSIPPELGSLSALRRLKLGGNSLTGPIPPELGRLRALWYLELPYNQLSGTIPPELGMLTGLDGLDLSNNLLSGPIPPELGRLRALRQLRLNNNMLRGPIPLEFSEITSLTDLQVGSNLLDCAPPELPRIWLVASGLPYCLE